VAGGGRDAVPGGAEIYLTWGGQSGESEIRMEFNTKQLRTGFQTGYVCKGMAKTLQLR
jgi:hypothetical protein